MLKKLAKRILPLVAKAAEGEYHDGPWQLPITGGWLPADVGQYWNWWQLGYNPVGSTAQHSMVEACVSAYCQTVSMCPGDHWVLTGKGGRERVETSALSRILRHPNFYQSMTDFMLNLTRQLYIEGNAYALAIRNDRFEIGELHLMDSNRSFPQIVPATGDVFYTLAGNDIVSNMFGHTSNQTLLVPQRDVLHVRLHNSRRRPFPIRGESPLVSAMADIAMGNAILQQQIKYFMNQARPSAVLTTDLNLDKDQVQALRDRWNEQVKSIDCGAGGTPILTNGLKVQTWSSSGGKDAQLAEVLKLSNDNIAMAFRVPQQILGVPGRTSGTNIEALMQLWIATGLGFALNLIEEAFGVTFNLWGQPDEYVEFSTSSLLRSAFKDRIEGLTRAVQGGIFSPNEARNEEGMDDVEFGDEPRVQQQVVPLSAASSIPTKPGASGKTPPAPGPEGPPSAAPASSPSTPLDNAPKQLVTDMKRDLLFAADKYDRANVN
jgi:HK97 family phage portal protein